MRGMKRLLVASLLLMTGVGLLGGCSQSFEREPQKEAVAPPPPPPAPTKMAPATPGCVVYAYPTGDPRTSIALLQKCMPPQVVAGVPFDFTLTVTNTSEMVCLDDVVVTDKLPADMKMQSASPNPDSQGDTLRWSLGRVNPKEVKQIKVTAVVSKAGTLTQCASMTCTPKACLEIVAVQPALKLVKSAPAMAMLCDQIPMELTVTNTGSGNATDVVVNDNLPAGLMTIDGKSSVSVPVGTLAPNQSKQITIITKASKTGSYENTGHAVASGGLKTDSNSTTTVVKQPVLEITKKALQDKVLVGRGTGTFTHEITVKNTGDGDAANTMVVDTPPAGVTIVKADGASSAGGKLQWNLGTLAPGASKTMQVTFSTATSGTYTNNATASAVCASPVSASAKTEVSGIPAVLLEMVDDPDPVRVGDIVTYTIIVTNQGSAADTTIAMSAKLTDEMQFVSCGPLNNLPHTPPAATERYNQVNSTNGAYDAASKTVKFTPVATLGAKQYVVWQIKVKALKPKDVRFDVTLTTDETKAGGVITKSESTRFYE